MPAALSLEAAADFHGPLQLPSLEGQFQVSSSKHRGNWKTGQVREIAWEAETGSERGRIDEVSDKKVVSPSGMLMRSENGC